MVIFLVRACVRACARRYVRACACVLCLSDEQVNRPAEYLMSAGTKLPLFLL